MNIENSGDDFVDANKGIDKLEDYFELIGMPTRMTDLGLTNVKFEEMADSATDFGKKCVLGIENLDKYDIIEIYKTSYNR